MSKSEVIRRAIDSQVLDSEVLLTDAQAWAEARDFMESLAQRGSVDRSPITWSRAERYD